MSSEIQALQCSVCMQGYNEEDRCPRLLSCGHSFCSSCLQGMLQGSIISCPQDRKVFVAEGVDSLSKNFALLSFLRDAQVHDDASKFCELCDGEKHFAVLYCVECGQGMCKLTSSYHEKSRATKHHSLIPTGKMDLNKFASTGFCTDHNQAYRCFDSDCKILICADCFTFMHSSHNCQSFFEAAANCRTLVHSLRSEVQCFAENLSTEEKRAASELQLLGREYQDAKEKLEAEFEQVSKIFAARKKELSSKVEEIYKSKSSVLHNQIEENKSLNLKLSQAVSQAESASEVERDFPLLLAYGDLKKALLDSETLLRKTFPPMLESGEVPFKFYANSKILSRKIGKFATINRKKDGSWCYQARGSGLTFYLKGSSNTFFIFRSNSSFLQGDDLMNISPSFRVRVGGSPFWCNVQDKKDGLYKASYSFQGTASNIEVSVKLEGTHIEGSPFLVPTFFERLVDFKEVDGRYTTTTVPNYRYKSLATSVCFLPSDALEFLLEFYWENVTNKGAVRVFLMDENGEFLSYVPKSNTETKSQVECVVNSCGCSINESKKENWEGYLKLGVEISGQASFKISFGRILKK